MKRIIILLLAMSPVFIACSLKADNKQLEKENDNLYEKIQSLRDEIDKLKKESVSYEFYQSQIALEVEKNEELQEENRNYMFFERNVEMKISFYNDLLTYLLSVQKFDDIEISGIVSPIDSNQEGIKVVGENLLTGKNYTFETSTILKNGKESFCEYTLLLPVGVYRLHAEYSDGSIFDWYKVEGYISIYPGIEKNKINIYSQ